MRSKPVYLIYFVMCAGLIACDRWTKYLVMTRLSIGEAFPSQDAFAAIRYTVNTGVSFSMLSGHSTLLVVLQSALFVVVAVGCVYTYLKLRHPVLQTGLTWIVAGGAGNLADRVLYGHVIDFISVGTFPVWNFADMCIVGGCILIGIYILWIYGKPKTDIRETERTK